MAEESFLTLGQAALIYGMDEVKLFTLLAEIHGEPIIFMARPANPSGVGRPAKVYRLSDIEAAIQKDAEDRLGAT